VEDDNDTTLDASTATGAEDGSGGGSSAKPQGEDWEKRFRGLNVTYGKLHNEKKGLETSLEAAKAEASAAKQEVDSISATYEKNFKALQDQMAQMSTQLQQLTTQQQREATRQQMSGIIQKDLPHVFDDWKDGLLKEPDSFKNAEEYMGYLKTLNERRIPATQPDAQANAGNQRDEAWKQRRDLILGVTPSANPGSTQQKGSGQRTLDDIRREMEGLDNRDPKYQSRMDALTKEMDTVLPVIVRGEM